MASSSGISGVGVAVVGAGAYLLYAGITDAGLIQGLRDLMAGQAPKPLPADPSKPKPWYTSPERGSADAAAGIGASAASTALGAQTAVAGQKYIGRPYQWGHTFATPTDGGDCSGLCFRAYADCGVAIPRSTSAMIASPRFAKVSRSEVGAGDLCWWPGHVVLAIDNTRAVCAQTTGTKVQILPIDKAGPWPLRAPVACLRWKTG